MFVEAKCLIFASHKSAGEPPIKVVDWFPSSVVKTESNQDQKHLEASSSKDAFCLCSPLCPCRRSVHHDRIIFGILVFLTFWYLGIFGILTTRQTAHHCLLFGILVKLDLVPGWENRCLGVWRLLHRFHYLIEAQLCLKLKLTSEILKRDQKGEQV